MAAMLRVDRGTETGVMATLHSFLRRHHGDMDPSDSVVYGPSTEKPGSLVTIQVLTIYMEPFLTFIFEMSSCEGAKILLKPLIMLSCWGREGRDYHLLYCL